MTLLRSLALGLTSLGLVIACGEAPPGPGPGAGGSTNPSSGGTGNPSSGGGQGVGGNVNTGVGGNVGNTGGNVGNTGGNVGNTGGNVGNTGGNVGNTGGGGPDVDEMGKMNASAGETTSTAQDYLRLGEIRILNNNWGSEDLGCAAPMSVFVNEDSSFGWTFNRPTCGGDGSKPDFPQIEFGIHPFGINSPLATSPDFSSTTLLPKRIAEIQSATVQVDNLSASFQSEGSWNITFEFWLSEQDPNTQGNAGVYAELMTFWGWQGGRWPEDGPGQNGAFTGGSVSGPDQVQSGGKSYTLWVQRDQWAPQPPEAPNGWRYYQFRDNSGPQKNFSGTLDVKPFLDYLVQQRNYSDQLWVTRLEVGSEIDDNTSGTVSMQGITFTVNGESRSEIIQP